MSSTLTALIKEHVTFFLIDADAVEITRLCRILIEKLVFLLRVTELMVVNLMILVHV